MTSKRMAHDVNMCKKHSFTPIVTNIFDDTKRAKKMLLALLHLTRLFFPQITLPFILQWHIGVYEEKFDVNKN